MIVASSEHFTRALASAGDRNATPKVIYWLAWI